MAITDISIHEDNKVGDSDLLAVHSPLTFLVDVTYTGAVPDVLYCDVYDEDALLLSTFKCIPYQDLLPTQRRFIFIADSIIRGYMDSFDDFVQSENSLVHVDGATKIFELKFRDPDAGVSDESVTFTAINAAREFGENPNLSEIFNNDTQTYIAAKDETVYVYFYNDDTANIITIGDSFITKFIISDSVGFLENALIEISTLSELTDVNGEAEFTLIDGSYSYSISKEGYVTKEGNFDIDGGNLLFEIELVSNTQAVVTFHAEYNSVDQENVFIEIKKGGVLIESGYTDVNGDLIKNLYLDTYDIIVSELYWQYEVAPYQLIVNTDPQTDNLVITLKQVYPVTFQVRTFGDIKLENAEIGNQDYILSGDPNDTWRNQSAILVTDVNGEVVANDLPGTDFIGVRKTGYVSTSIQITTIAASHLQVITLTPE